MRVPNFSITNHRSVRLASCDAVPSLMIIAGPNGTGKSTLLNAIRSNAGYSNIIYLGPHRAMRKQNVQMRHLMAGTLVLEDLLSLQDSPGFDGIQLIGGQRDPWGHDDSSNYLKHTLCQIQVDFQAAIAQRYERDKEIKKGSIDDPWKPLRELCANLLPHLRFDGIDVSNQNQLRCLWRVHGSAQSVDLDDLSSGEKSIIQMFFPLVEREIRALLASVSGDAASAARPEQCVLIDEPELHLHPNLQVKVLDYLRVLASATHAQVIVATHSPTVVESASFDELFLLRPTELVAEGENQLVQLATDDERLELLRSLFGTTSNLTSMQPIVVVEGVHENDARHVVADRKLYRALHPGFDHVTLVAGGGKSECVTLAKGLRAALQEFSSKLRAVALVDKDYVGVVGAQGDVFRLPVSMIENLLLDPEALREAIESVVEKTSLKSVSNVADALAAVLDGHEEDEVERRAASKFKSARFQPSRPVSELYAKAAEFGAQLVAQFSEVAVQDAMKGAREEVQSLKAGARRREEFHGKDVLRKFFAAHLHNTGLAKDVIHLLRGTPRSVAEGSEAVLRRILQGDSPGMEGRGHG